jgi:HAD superfamily hydrolase (TIGR01509 family)
MIKAIVFDCFGVLASDGWLPFKARYFEDDPGLNQQAAVLSKEVDAGRADYDDFIRKVAQMANLSEEQAREQIENNIPDEKLFAYIRELKHDYQIGLLSNAGDNWLNDIFSADQVDLFDAVALSYEVGVIKPDIRAYQTVAERLQVQTKECVFIDDQPKFIEGARQAGMHALLYTNADQLKQELSALLADS